MHQLIIIKIRLDMLISTCMVYRDLGPSRTRGQFQIWSGQIRLEIGQWQKKLSGKLQSHLRTKSVNTTPCCFRLVILGFLTDHAFQPTFELKASPLLYCICPEPSCSRLTKMHGAKKMVLGLMPALSYLLWTGEILATSQYSWSGWAGISSFNQHVRVWQRIDPSWWILWIFVGKKLVLRAGIHVVAKWERFTKKSIA